MTTEHECCPLFWALCYHSNSSSPRAKRWYYISRAVTVDGRTYAVGERHSFENRLAWRAIARMNGWAIAPGLWRAPTNAWHFVNEIERS